MKVALDKSHWLHALKAQTQSKDMAETSHSRLWVIIIVFSLCFSVLALRLFAVSFSGGGADYAQKEAVQSPLFNRREIVDRNNQVVAINLATASLHADPKVVMDPGEAAKKLHKLLPEISYKNLLTKLMSEKRFVWIKRNLTPKEQYAVNSLGIPGLYFRREEKRIYPQGNLFAHILGYVGVDGKGLTGIEKYLDTELQATTEGDKEVPLQLSVDVRVQNVLHEELSRHMTTFKALGAAGMVMDVHTGEVLAMVSLPDFDPNDIGTASGESRFNRATLGVYEMGSTFKVLTTALALDTGVTSIRGGYDVEKPIRAGRFTIRDFHAKGGWLSVPEILMYSSNIGTARMALDIGSDMQQYFLKELGMLSPAVIELPERGRPIVPTTWGEVRTMTVSYGHGIAVTPLHLVRAISAVVNGGMLYTPTLLKRESKDKIVGTSVLSKKTSSQMRQLLRLVVDSGTGKKADAEGYMVGGKTGTAEKVGESGRYKKKALLSSFVSAFPMQNPRYVVLAMLDEPKGNKSTGYYATGGQVAAPIVKQVVSRIGPMLGVMPVDKNSEDIRRHFWVEIKSEGDEVAAY